MKQEIVQNNYNNNPSENVINIKKVAATFLDNWVLFFSCCLMGLFVAFLTIRYSDSHYKIHAQVLIKDNTNSPGGDASSLLGGASGGMMQDFSSLLGVTNNVNNEAAILQSRDLIRDVVDALHLNITYYRLGQFGTAELYKTSPFIVNFLSLSDTLHNPVKLELTNLGRNKFKLESSDLDTVISARFNDTITTAIGKFYLAQTAVPFLDAKYRFTAASPDQVVDNFLQDLDVEITDKSATVVDIGFKSNIQQKGEDILRALIDTYIKGDIEQKGLISDSTLAFIDARVAILNTELNSIENGIQNFKQNNKIASMGEQSKVLIDNASTYYNQLSQVQVQQEVIETTLNYLQTHANNNRVAPAININQDPNFLALLQRYNTLQLQREKLRLSNTSNNPTVLNLDDQIKNLREDMISSLTNQKNSILIAKNKTQGEINKINNLVQQVPGQERTYSDLARQQKVKEELYLYLLEKREETAIAKSSNITSARVIETPKSEFEPYFPKKGLLYISGFFLGIIIPYLGLYVRESLNNRINSRKDIEELTDCPIIGEISHSKKENRLEVSQGSRSVIAEQFRALRTNLQFITGEKEGKIMLVTSSMSSEGKSFIVLNLSQVYAISGKKVLIIELDLRKPKISSYLDMDNVSGFSNYIVSDLKLEHLLKPLSINENTFVLNSGPIPPNPAELLMSPKVPQMLARLKTMFDLIIIDSPPVGLVTDAQIIADHSDINLYVTRHEYTLKAQIDIINDLKESGKFKNLYVIINDVKKSNSYKYGYSYGYGYGYGNGYSYGNGNGHDDKSDSKIVKWIRKKETV